MLTAKESGEKLWKRINVKLFLPGNKKFKTRILHAPPGKGFAADGIEEQLRRLSDEIETKFPNWEYRLVPTAPNCFNFVWEGRRAEAS